MDKYEAADLIIAAYYHAANYYSGQWSPLYARLCAMGKIYKPGPFADLESEGDGVRMWYDELVAATNLDKHDDLPMEDKIQEAVKIMETAEF
jgi:hypothetical protein